MGRVKLEHWRFFKLPKTFCRKLNLNFNKFWWSNSNENEKGINWMSWLRIAIPKNKGGMGFRDVEKFNVALLARQAWRLILNPEALWARVLKGVYFPHSMAINANRKPNPSWAWKSIMEGMQLIKSGLRQNINSGGQTYIWGDRWIPTSVNFMVATPKPDDMRAPVLVKDLISPETRSWKQEMLDRWFTIEDKRAIMQIPIGDENDSDSAIWHHTKDGNYYAKSGYMQLLERPILDSRPSSSYGREEEAYKGWKSIWDLQAIPKVKNLLWRVCNNAVATKENLLKKKRGFDNICPRCHESIETIEHVIFFCPFARVAWGVAGFKYTPNTIGFVGMKKWWDAVSNALPTFGDFCSKSVVAYFIWHLWTARNKLVFDHSTEDPQVIWTRAVKDYSDLKVLSVQGNQSSNTPQTTHAHAQQTQSLWTPPSGMVIKINSDASFEKNTNAYGIAAVARNYLGSVVAGRTERIMANNIEVAEASAVRLATLLARDYGFQQVVFEMDCKNVAARLQKKGKDQVWDTMAIEKDIMSICSNFQSVEFLYVKRECNLLADWAAKAAQFLGANVNWNNVHVIT